MELYDLIVLIEQGWNEPVLVTVIGVEGHAYRKAGACLLAGCGRTAGSISPGCLEADLAARAEAVWRQRTPELVDYELREDRDALWGEAIGCGGSLRVLLEPVRGRLLELLLAAKRELDAGAVVRLVRRIEAGGRRVRCRLEAVPATEEAGTGRLAATAGGRELTLELRPKPRLVVFGAGEDAVPLVKLAVQIGFRTVVADWREGLCTAERFPGAELVVGSPEEALLHLALNERDYAVVMSHQLQRDRAFVRGLLERRLRYAGIMGSRTRTERLLDGTAAPEWLHYPVGLDIGADGPDEIAVAIAAELLAVKRESALRHDREARENRDRRDSREAQ
jgi:xanthine dehydrogenase accessory factor